MKIVWIEAHGSNPNEDLRVARDRRLDLGRLQDLWPAVSSEDQGTHRIALGVGHIVLQITTA
jgi:hypothetical protein